MAKQSAKSKGFRKSVEKKPYLSKKDIIILCVVLVAVAIGAILLFTYDDGALKYKDGKIVDPGENWLIVNGNTKGGRRYYKLGEVSDIPGYTMEAQPFPSDANLIQFNYSPEAEDGAITGVTIYGSAYDPARLSQSSSRMVGGVENSVVSDIAKDTAGGVEYTYYTYTHEYYAPDETVEEATSETEEAAEEAPAEADETPNRFEQAITGYMNAPHDGSIVITVSAKADSADGYLPEDQLKEALGQAIAAVTLEEGK